MNNIIKKQRNVTLGQRNVNKDYYFQCPLCENMLEIKMTKKNKPYVVCNDCGMQIFIRRQEGINKLNHMRFLY